VQQGITAKLVGGCVNKDELPGNSGSVVQAGQEAGHGFSQSRP
jgi:hypothetical protein